MLLVGGVCKIDRNHVAKWGGGGGGEAPRGHITGRCLDISRISLPGQSVLAINSKSEECAKPVRV